MSERASERPPGTPEHPDDVDEGDGSDPREEAPGDDGPASKSGVSTGPGSRESPEPESEPGAGERPPDQSEEPEPGGKEPGGNDDGGSGQEPVESHEGWGVNDQRTEEDHLDFDTYVSVLYDFLTHGDTNPPLTISIEGEWGTGKSSFMALLRKELERADGRHREGGGTRYFTVEFNPWRHEREDALWAAFMLEFFDQITDREQMGLANRWLGHLRLARRRLQWRHGWRDLLRLGLVVPLVLLALWFPSVATDLGIPLTDFGRAVGQGVSVVALGVWTWQNVANPIETELRAYMTDPEYENRVSFIERFHTDFGGILDSYVGTDSRVFVFIDDLDRCPPPKAAELIQSINLMISSGDSRVFFLLGMDRSKVAAGIAAKHEDLLGYLRATERRSGTRAGGQPTDGTEPSKSAGREVDADYADYTDYADTPVPSVDGSAEGREFEMEEYGLDFADNYLEKFVQIPFHIPRPGAEEIGTLIEEMLSGNDEEDGDGKGGDGEDGDGSTDDSTDREVADVLPDDELVAIGRWVAPALDYNPRMMKTFVNLFRLQTMLATDLGLIDERITTEQLAKFVAVGLEWPPLVDSLGEPARARALTEWALDNDGVSQPSRPPGPVRVPERELGRLAYLLATGVDESGTDDPYRLDEVPEELFWVSTRTDASPKSVEETASEP